MIPTLWKPFRDLERAFDSDIMNRQDEESFFAPKVHVEEDSKKLYVQAEVPGMEEKDIDVNINNDVLTISGERKNEKKDEQKGYYYSEISFGKFERRVRLPEYVNKDTAKAEYKRGVLNITMDKNPEKAPKQIEVQSAE